MKRWILLAVVLIAAVVVAGQWAMTRVAEPAYQTERSAGDVELRRYDPMILATVAVEGTRREAVNAGFRLLANYIFGGNSPEAKIDMTAPVLQTPAGGAATAAAEDAATPNGTGQTIAMTAPVFQQPTGARQWTVSFVMPEGYTMATLPKPHSGRVRLAEQEAQRRAVIRFSGLPNAGLLERKTASLRDFMAAEGLRPAGPPEFAFYDPPWTLPFLRRNEVMVTLAP